MKLLVMNVKDKGRKKDQKQSRLIFLLGLIQVIIQFLKKEMKMTDDDIKTMGEERIFAPNKDNWDTLYVRLDSEADVSFLMAFKTKASVIQQFSRPPFRIRYLKPS